ncbi:baculoviral IAP repeat-containing protein 7-like [Physella acuta]|uniref:baculoviral IAP repeat-containing protein 7-like n=1 Tax=Physella acuta TaxID=109671 RepID=UPI0027DB2E2E|nr:baculoviral IAP repeat-containing protein 7-like [Physella acuta]XP_059152421.1 baculoviral IAP repeat-containing protein 7-like [Physella acuta]XP_059152422.1 baculoviral IAP repeat-containing protein 7-like [Physella acuta]XP_059152423.1 baculoviral IAP repeat-containing protein 7-like [Physella acuta]
MDLLESSLYSKEIVRIGTYLGWPGQDIQCKPTKPSVLDLAKAGFLYTGQRDEVRCFVCNLKVEDWERYQDPRIVHTTRSPHCPFMLNAESNNAPVLIPSDKEYKMIKLMLREAGRRVSSSANGSPYPSSSLILDTLKAMYGDTLTSASHPNSSRQSSTSRSLSNSPRVNHKQTKKDMTASSGNKTSFVPRSSHSSNSPPPRRSSTSEAPPQDSPGRPNFQRAKSCAYDPRSQRNSETIANRQTSTSNPGIDFMEYQDSEEARLRTFSGWTGIRGAPLQEFAQAGFIYIGSADRVQCVFCKGILRNWNDNDNPLEEHRKHFPQCTFIKDIYKAIVTGKPKHPKYAMDQARLSSFSNWDVNQNPKPADLAKAGFFYVGHGDSVKCFYCDGGLRNWEPNDDPWREHARWFPRCSYVKQSKGQAFIENVLKDINLTDYQTASVDETELKIARATGQRDIDPREVTARMDSPIVKAVLRMDIPKERVKKAIRNRLAENGEDFNSAEALLEAVFSHSSSPDHLNESPTTEVKSGKDLEPENGSLHSGGSENQDSMRLMEENRLLKEQRQCKICMDEEVCVVFLPCGHLVCCSTCAPALTSCPICRAKIRGTVRTYIS